MGLGISIEASHSGNEDECRARLRAFFENEPCVVPGKAVTIFEHDPVFRAGLFFTEEDLYCTFAEEGRISISAKTNGAGPGYHAYIVDLLGRMRSACSLAWDDEDLEDETEYWHHRDFGDLQLAMADWLVSLANALVENHMEADVSGLAISMGTERVPDDATHYAAHLLGWLDRDFFLATRETGVTPEQCASFFIWWERDAATLLKCALSMMWCDCNWLAPVTDGETHLFTSAFLCLEQAWDDDPALAYPVREWKEMAGLSDSEDLSAELDRRFPENPAPTVPIGYLRGPIRRDLGNGWRMTMPGAMHEDIDGEEGTVLVYWDGKRTVRVSRFTVTGDDIDAESLLDTLTEDVENAGRFPLEYQGEVLARISREPQKDDDGSEYFGTFFFAAVDAGQVLYISAFYDDEEDGAWAEAMFASCVWQGN